MSNYTEKNIPSSMRDILKDYLHIVIFTGGAYPEPENTITYWKNMPVPDFIIAADSGLDVCNVYTGYENCFFTEKSARSVFSPHLILGDMDSLQDKTLLDTYADAEKKVFEVAKDYTDTELALKYAYLTAEKKDKKAFITLLGGDGGRIDHLLGIYDTFATDEHPSVWLCRHQTLWFAPEKSIFLLSGLSPSDKISFLRLSNNFSGGGLKTKGLAWNDTCFRKHGMPSISNQISDSYYSENKAVEIQIKKKNFIIALPPSALVIYHWKER